jgi:hypothetical protein
MERTWDVRFRSTTTDWPDSSDEALNHVGVFQSHLERIEWRYLMDIARPHCESSSRKSLIGGKTS